LTGAFAFSLGSQRQRGGELRNNEEVNEGAHRGRNTGRRFLLSSFIQQVQEAFAHVTAVVCRRPQSTKIG
jgi:hypothetical protein